MAKLKIGYDALTMPVSIRNEAGEIVGGLPPVLWAEFRIDNVVVTATAEYRGPDTEPLLIDLHADDGIPPEIDIAPLARDVVARCTAFVKVYRGGRYGDPVNAEDRARLVGAVVLPRLKRLRATDDELVAVWNASLAAGTTQDDAARRLGMAVSTFRARLDDIRAERGPEEVPHGRRGRRWPTTTETTGTPQGQSGERRKR
ncbi:hypothetical protein [Marmoricola sp. RAF53]|uniref:hypothetical protein n=1 Tax=Marmoricola sp. RAF53 TaxID=3233059 RepID=UPI003F9EB3B8